MTIGAASSAESGRLPDFLIVGAMRSGTTSLARALGGHPHVFMADGKEVHFFDRHFERGLRWYADQFRPSSGEVLSGEATQTYMYDEPSVGRISRTLPGCRLIAILRDPVDRAYSHYWHNRARGKEPLGFREAIDAEPDRLATGDVLVRSWFSYLDRSRYVFQLTRLCEHVARDRLLVLLFEEFRDRPDDVYRETCRFLGIDETFRPDILGEALNPYLSFRSVELRNRTRDMPRSFQRLIGRLNSRPSAYPPMPAGIRAELIERFEEDNNRLADWWGRDLSPWWGIRSR